MQGPVVRMTLYFSPTETRARAARKLALIEQKMADLVVMQQLLGELVQQCDAGDGGTICPIIEALIRE